MRRAHAPADRRSRPAPTDPVRDEAAFILSRARAVGLHESAYGAHLANRVPILNYIRIADELKRLMPAGRLLDWGCGMGQMSLLLRRRGLAVESYDVSDHAHRAASPVFADVTISHGDHPVHLPYSDAAFHGVLSCGVLEHVADEPGSLAEIRRVLRNGGWFFVYNLPQRGSYKEWVLSRFHLGYTHDRQYTLAGSIARLEGAGFQVVRARRSGMLPHNLTPFPRLRGLYDRAAVLVFALDRGLSGLWPINRTAEALELAAVKRPR